MKKSEKKKVQGKPIAVKAQKLAYRQHDFEAYTIWRSLPSLLRGKSKEELKEFGIVDEVAIELLSIENQKQFAEKFKIPDHGTLTDWNRKIDENGLLTMNPLVNMMRRMTPNVVTALYKNAVKHGDAPRARVWLEAMKMIGPATVVAVQNNISQTKVIINQKVINIGKKYEQELRGEIEQEIRSAERLRDGGAAEGGAESEQDSGERNSEAASSESEGDISRSGPAVGRRDGKQATGSSR